MSPVFFYQLIMPSSISEAEILQRIPEYIAEHHMQVNPNGTVRYSTDIEVVDYAYVKALPDDKWIVSVQYRQINYPVY